MEDVTLEVLPLGGKKIRQVALVGNPNSGKTSIFNGLTGAQQHVGNYPGVTVERKEGRLQIGDTVAVCTDLPGTYSLSSRSMEERITRGFLLEEHPEVVLDVVDAGNLERNLYLTVQLMELGANLVLVLNMADELERSGMVLDLGRLSRRLGGVPVVLTEGNRSRGRDELREAIVTAASSPRPPQAVPLGSDLEQAVSALVRAMGPEGLRGLPRRAVAIRLLEEDEEVAQWLRSDHPMGSKILDRAALERSRLERILGAEPAMAVAERRYGFIHGLLKEITLQPALEQRADWTGTIDSVLTHRLLGLPIFLGVMYTLFWFTFTLGEAPMGWIESGFELLGAALLTVLGPTDQSLLSSLLVDGVIGGVGGVLVFLPNIVLLFFGISLLEDSGYMSRAAFLVDRVMHHIGLHGKSFIPMVVGFGCTVPGVMACRTLDSERDRITTMFVLPLISCGARLPIYMLLIPAFFAPAWRAPILMGVYLLGVLLAALLAALLRQTLLAGDSTPFVMELPPYRAPTLRGMLLHIWQRSWMYLRKAGTVILGISILMWAAAAFPVKTDFDVDRSVAAGELQLAEADLERARALESLEYTVAGRVGHAIEPILKPLEFDWRIGTALLGAFAAKEVVVSQLGIVFSLEEGDPSLEDAAKEESSSETLRSILASRYPARVGLGLIIFCLISSPCMATVAVVAKESGRWRWALLQWTGLTALAWAVVFFFNQLAKAFGL